MSRTPFQDDGLYSLDLQVKDFDALERIHKQYPWDADQQYHFAAGWEAAMVYYKECFKRETP
jgi:hypothetical protein